MNNFNFHSFKTPDRLLNNFHFQDSEVLSVRMKLENTERALGDQRAMAGELAERYGEAQRELSRAKAAIQVYNS